MAGPGHHFSSKRTLISGENQKVMIRNSVRPAGEWVWNGNSYLLAIEYVILNAIRESLIFILEDKCRVLSPHEKYYAD